MKMRLNLVPAAALGLLTLFAALSPAQAASKQAEDYFYVRDKAQLHTGYGDQDLVQPSEAIDGKTIELRGAIIGTVDTAVVLKQSNPPLEVTVNLPDGKQLRDYQMLGVNAAVRLICRVHRDAASNGGRIILVVPVKESDAAAMDAEREKAQLQKEKLRSAANAKKPRQLASRSGSTAVAKAGSRLSREYVIQKYTEAVLYFNRRLAPGTAKNIATHIVDYSKKYKLDGRLVMAVVCCESNFNPHAVSRVGAMGLGQLMPGTAGDLGVGNAFNIQENLEGSTRLFANHIATMEAGGRPKLEAIKLALACYNAGAGAVRKYKGIPPYQETQQYVKKIIRLYWQMLPEDDKKGWKPD